MEKELIEFYVLKRLAEKVSNSQMQRTGCLPDKRAICLFIDSLHDLLFPDSVECQTHHATIEEGLLFIETGLHESSIALEQILAPFIGQMQNAESIVQQFYEVLPEIFDILLLDAASLHRMDPAATSESEVISTYPGFRAISYYRYAHILNQCGVQIVPRIITEYAHELTGIDIHPGAQIGHSFAIDHGTGVVIGETSTIGTSVSIYQGVTLGSLSVSKDDRYQKRHPTIGDRVTIYANATILGGDTVIGNDSIIGGNTWVTASVPPKSKILYKS